MDYTRSIDIPAPAHSVWTILEDVESWPTWAPTFIEVALDGVLRVGAEVGITQPGRRPMTYRIQALEPGRRFQWGATGRAVVQWADHVVVPTGPDSCRVTLTFSMSGWLGGPLAALVSRQIRAMVDSEAESLARHAGGRNDRPQASPSRAQEPPKRH